MFLVGNSNLLATSIAIKLKKVSLYINLLHLEYLNIILTLEKIVMVSLSSSILSNFVSMSRGRKGS